MLSHSFTSSISTSSRTHHRLRIGRNELFLVDHALDIALELPGELFASQLDRFWSSR
jgi:hypothetical protein